MFQPRRYSRTVKSAIQSSRNCLAGATILLLLAVNSLAQPAKNAPSASPAMLRALILSGEGSHDWRTTTPFLRQLLLDSGRFDVRVSESPAGLTTKTLAGFDVVVDDYSGPRLGTEAEKALETFVAAGKGLVVTHGGLAGSEFGKLTKASWPANVATGADTPLQLFDLKTIHSE